MSATGCVTCPSNRYSEPGAVECTKCPKNKVSRPGSTSLNDCTSLGNVLICKQLIFTFEYKLYLYNCVMV